MNEIDGVACGTPGCDNRGKPGLNLVGYGSFATKSGRRQRNRCTVCRGTLSTNTGTAYSGLHCTRREFENVASLRVEGVSISATARVTGHSRNTVARWLERASTAARRFNDKMVRDFDLQIELQADELCTFIDNKSKTVWLLATIEVSSRLWAGSVLGRRSDHNARTVISDAVRRGRVVGYPLIATDGFEYYAGAVGDLFGPACVFGQVLKTRRNNRVVRVERRVKIGTSARLKAAIEEGQVDYGSGPMVRDPHAGRDRRTRLFAFTLGYSRKSVRLLVWRSTTQIWAELHERAFRRLGGTVRVVVHDNLREGVLTPDIYDPTLNPLYRDVLAHYGVIALPCRVRDPDRKGTVEARIGHAQKTPLKGLRFETLIGAQAYLDRWETRWADTRIHGTTNRQVAAMFAEERPALGPLPLEPFRYYRHGVRTVHLDGCVEVEAASYSAPPGWIGQRVQVQWDGARVRLLAPTTGVLLRELLRSPRGWHRIHDADRPARTPRSTLTLLARATRAGPGIGTLC